MFVASLCVFLSHAAMLAQSAAVALIAGEKQATLGHFCQSEIRVSFKCKYRLHTNEPTQAVTFQ